MGPENPISVPLDEAARVLGQAADKINEARNALTNYLVDVLGQQAVANFSPAPSHTGRANSAERPPASAILREQITKVWDKIVETAAPGNLSWEVVNNGRVFRPPAKDISRIRQNLLEALRDPNQIAAAFEALKPLEFNGMRNQYESDAVMDLLDKILYGDGTNPLIAVATSQDAEASGRAQDLIIGTYPWSKQSTHNLAETTAYIATHNVDILERYIFAESDFSSSHNDRSNVMAAFSRAIAEASREDTITLTKSLRKGAGQREYSTNKDRAIKLYNSALDYLANSSTSHEPLLKKFGLDPDRVMEAWASGHGGKIFKFRGGKRATSYAGSKFMINNIQNMLDAEAQTPGICQSLVEELGICSFARYTPEILQEAYEALSNPPNSWVLVATARIDPRGAFSGNDDSVGIREQIRAENPHAKVIPIELGNLKDIRNINGNLRRRGFGEAEHVIINAHGKPKLFELDTDSYLTADGGNHTDVISWRYTRILLGSIVKEGGRFVLGSCSAGLGPDCMGEQIATASGRETLAPGEDVAVERIEMVRDPATGKLVPYIYYIADTGAPSPTLVFNP